MPDELSVLDAPRARGGMPVEAPGASAPGSVGIAPGVRPHLRLLHGMRRPANWLQLIRFGIVGGTGFIVNLAVYALCVHALDVPYQGAAVVAWLVAVTNNFFLNRHWTFDARAGSARFQAIRFFIVSLLAFAFGLLLLTVFVEAGGLAKVPAQALAVAAATPLNFIGNKLWSFRHRS